MGRRRRERTAPMLRSISSHVAPRREPLCNLVEVLERFMIRPASSATPDLDGIGRLLQTASDGISPDPDALMQVLDRMPLDELMGIAQQLTLIGHGPIVTS